MSVPPPTVSQSQSGFIGTERFELVRRLGQGGMGTVYEALDHEQQRHVALKTLNTLSAESIVRFKNEFRALSDLQHRNLIRLYELFQHPSAWFFTMELLDGVDLLSYVRPLSVAGSGRTAPDGSVNSANLGNPAGAPDPLTSSSQRTEDVVLPTRIDAADETSGTLQLPPGAALQLGHPGVDETRLRDVLAQLVRGLGALHAAQKVHCDIKPRTGRLTDAPAPVSRVRRNPARSCRFRRNGPEPAQTQTGRPALRQLSTWCSRMPGTSAARGSGSSSAPRVSLASARSNSRSR